MNDHAVRLHMCQVYVCTAQDVVLCVGQASLRVSCCVLLSGWGTAEVSRGRTATFPSKTTSRSGAPGRMVGEVEDLRKDACVQPCGVTRASLVRARAARALSEAAESRRAVAHVPGVRMYCTGCGAVRGASVSSCVLLCSFVAGALRRSHAEGRQPPIPKGWTSRSRRTSHFDRPPGRPCRESPGLFVLSLSCIPWSATDSGSSVHPAQLPWIARRLAIFGFRARVSTPY